MVPELLAPAGNLEKLETALRYGADAVYCGVEQFSLRALAGNLTVAELSLACETTHSLGKRLYLTLNAFLRPGEEVAARELLESLLSIPVDAYIVADPGMLHLVRQIDPGREVHLSTQANTTSGLAAHFWQDQGVKRLNLARELSLQEIAAIRASVTLGLEVFVHGAMCMAYSGRCLLSAGLSGRSANHGTCSHPCRWKYSLQEEMRPGEYMPIEEDERGTYIFNSRDLCLIGHLPDLINAGVDSLKIEGRMKSLYYVAAVTRVYRAALDAWRDDPDNYRVDPQWYRELEAVSHRPYGTGFLFEQEQLQDRAFVTAENSDYLRDCDFVGIVQSAAPDGDWLVGGRNRFKGGERLEIIGPGMRQGEFVFGEAVNAKGEVIATVQPNAVVRMALPAGTQPGDMLRRWRSG
ncbi:MAG: U32 family peptidase C-terminal domain-containing protein [Desulfuromonadales bacterium]|nr:U32 family peptidase C-terminal domain-containing protein [Desulfuromonadales bacterium]